MDADLKIPASLAVFWETAPQSVTKALTALSAAVSLTDDVAFALIKECAPSPLPPEEIVSYLSLCSFVSRLNGEWYLAPTAREVLRKQLYNDEELNRSAQTLLLDIAKSSERGLAEKAIPSYLKLKVGLAYHQTFFNMQEGLKIYTNYFTGEPTGEQWLHGVLSHEQQQDGWLPTEAVEPYFFRGTIAYREGRWREAERLFTEIKKLYFKSPGRERRREVAMALHLLGTILHRYRHRDDEAKNLLQHSLKIEERIGNTLGEAHVLHNLAKVIAANEPHKAEELLERSLQIGKEEGYLFHQAQVLHSWGEMVGGRRDLPKATEMLRRSLEIGKQTERFGHQAKVLHTWGKLIGSSNIAEAEKLLEESLGILKRLNDAHGQAQVLHTWGQMVSSTNIDKAEKLLTASNSILKRLDDSYGQAQVLHTWGRIIAPKNFGKAVDLLSRSLKIKRNFRDINESVRVLITLGDVYRDKGKWEKSRKFYQEVIDTGRTNKRVRRNFIRQSKERLRNLKRLIESADNS